MTTSMPDDNRVFASPKLLKLSVPPAAQTVLSALKPSNIQYRNATATADVWRTYANKPEVVYAKGPTATKVAATTVSLSVGCAAIQDLRSLPTSYANPERLMDDIAQIYAARDRVFLGLDQLDCAARIAGTPIRSTSARERFTHLLSVIRGSLHPHLFRTCRKPLIANRHPVDEGCPLQPLIRVCLPSQFVSCAEYDGRKRSHLSASTTNYRPNAQRRRAQGDNTMAQYLSQEWQDIAKDLAQSFPERAGATARMAMVVTGAPAGDINYYQIVENGKVTEQAVGTCENPDFTMTSTWDDSVKVQKGELDANAAFMQGRMKVTGNMAKLMQLMPLTMSPEYKAIQESLREHTEY